jgi:signal transduction histidine kinase
MGLGLSIVEAIVKIHDGEVEAQSKPGSGTTITVRLPTG